MLDSIFPKKTSKEWLAELNDADILATEVVDYRTMLASEQALGPIHAEPGEKIVRCFPKRAREQPMIVIRRQASLPSRVGKPHGLVETGGKVVARAA